MVPVIYSDRLLCVGCNKCLRACPVNNANIVTHDQSGRVIVSIDPRKCINCGACIGVCYHGARKYKDDMARMFHDLKAGKEISLIVDSDVRSNFPEYRKLFRWLTGLGIKAIHDGSLGLELFAWAHLKYLQRYRPFSLVTSYCPVVVSFCRKHRPELLPRLSPIMGPLMAHATFLKEHLGVTDALAALSACPAATTNAGDETTINYNITFRKLHEYLRTNQIDLGKIEVGAVPDECETVILPLHPSLKKIIKSHLDLNIRVDTARDRAILPLLEEYAKTDVENQATVFNLLYCRHGCSLGIGASPDNDFFKSRTLLDVAKRDFSVQDAENHVEQSFRYFENNLNVDIFKENYTPQGTQPENISEDDMERSFVLLGKEKGPERHFNCGYCGYETCGQMARSIALGTNLPENCVTSIKTQSEETKSKSTSYLELIHNVSEYLLLAVGSNYDANVEHALMAICYAMDGFYASLWKNVYNNEEKPICQRMVTYPSKMVNKNLVTVDLYDPPGWLDALMEGNSIMRVKTTMSNIERRKFLGRNVNTLLLTPIIAHGDFWGFISILKQEERIFSEEDVAVISICSNILAASLINQNLQGSFLDENINL